MRRNNVMCMAAMPMMPMMGMARMAWSAWYGRSRKSMECEPSQASARDRRWSAWPEARSEHKSRPLENVVDTARAAGSFGTLIEGLRVARLDTALAGSGPYTVFAPSDAAFAKLPADSVQALLKNPEELAKVLRLHVVSGRLTSAELGGVGALKTLGGQTLPVDTTAGVKVGRARVVKADIACENGVIHVLDAVLLPA
jgi:uncharacterized surface protein with fasciclin (FAS1) repeats